MYEDADASISYQDIVNALGGDLDKLQESFDNASGSAQAMSDTQLDNLDGRMTILKSSIEGVAIEIGEN